MRRKRRKRGRDGTSGPFAPVWPVLDGWWARCYVQTSRHSFRLTLATMLSVIRCLTTRCIARNRAARCWAGVSCFAFLLGIVPASHAQTGSEWWIGMGLGLGELFENEGEADRIGAAFSGALYASYQTRAHLLGLRTTAVSEITGDHVFDIGVLYGRATTGGRGHASFSAGLAVVGANRNPDNDIDIDACIPHPFCDFPSDSDDRPGDEGAFTVGIPLEVQVFARPRSVSSFGFGLYVFANVNLEVPFVGATASFQLGSFK